MITYTDTFSYMISHITCKKNQLVDSLHYNINLTLSILTQPPPHPPILLLLVVPLLDICVAKVRKMVDKENVDSLEIPKFLQDKLKEEHRRQVFRDVN